MKSVLATRGAKFVYENEWGNAKLNLTVLFIFSADGLTTPPTIVYPYSRLPAEIGASVTDPEWGIGVTPTGWVNVPVFINHLRNVFHPYLLKNKIQLPVTLFVDGHSSHITLEVSEVCVELQIILICLYPNATRIIQPADVSAFKPMKSMWKQGVLQWRRRNPTKMLTLKDMAPILKETVDKFVPNKETIKNGFRACGLHPWNPDAIDFSKCLGFDKKDEDVLQIDSSHATSITYEDFKSTVGDEMFKELLMFDSQNPSNVSDEFLKLHLLLQKFGCDKPRDALPSPTDASITQDVTDVRLHNLSNIAIKDLQLESNPIVIALNNEPNQTDCAIDHESSCSGVLPDFTGNSIMDRSILNETDDVVSIRMKDNASTEDFFSNPLDTQNAHGVTSENEVLDLSCLSSIKKQKLNIHEFLDCPNSPKRKGKKFTEKRSYVITSEKWRLEETSKMDRQRNELKAKEARKAQIEEKKKVAEKIKEAKKLMNSRRKEEKEVSLRIKQEKLDDECQSDKENVREKRSIKAKIQKNVKRTKKSVGS